MRSRQIHCQDIHTIEQLSISHAVYPVACLLDTLLREAPGMSHPRLKLQYAATVNTCQFAHVTIMIILTSVSHWYIL